MTNAQMPNDQTGAPASPPANAASNCCAPKLPAEGATAMSLQLDPVCGMQVAANPARMVGACTAKLLFL